MNSNVRLLNYAIVKTGSLLLLLALATASGLMAQNGSIDLSFKVDGEFNGPVTDMKVQKDGKLLVAGSFTAFNEELCAPLIRLNADGTRDRGFNVDASVFEKEVPDRPSLMVQSDGKIIFCSRKRGCRSYNRYDKLTRFEINGKKDFSFTDNSEDDKLRLGNTITLLPDDGFMISGGRHGYTIAEGKDGKEDDEIQGLVRLDKNGNVDLNFRVPDSFFDDNTIHNFLLSPEGNYVALASIADETGEHLHFLCLSGKGEIQKKSAPFEVDSYRGDNLNWVGDKISFCTRDTRFSSLLVISDENGKMIKLPVTTTNTEGRFTYVWIGTFLVLHDKRIVIAGNFDLFDGKQAKNFIIINPDGSIDETFQPDEMMFNCSLEKRNVSTMTNDLSGNLFVARVTNSCDVDAENTYGILKLNNKLITQQRPTANKESWLEQNMPNPFNSQTKINYSIPSYYKMATIEVVSMDNRLIGKFPIQPGERSFISYDASGLSSGSYYYILKADGAVLDKKKMLVAK